MYKWDIGGKKDKTGKEKRSIVFRTFPVKADIF